MTIGRIESLLLLPSCSDVWALQDDGFDAELVCVDLGR